MATKRRTDYPVDEDALKRMMAGDVTALEKKLLRKRKGKCRACQRLRQKNRRRKTLFRNSN